ncbi:hypothetical protein GCM10010842_24840 [Deinococcus daejeonensis]|uniref:DUF4403 family protein n=2 Tax=Deinococcus daejeonensis TaxID=1007098 RepID=A0ABQ2J4W6_9DEIO|nr:hypothetical protein GCM10010842_24840 [Deinococcus daejeonensis]
MLRSSVRLMRGLTPVVLTALMSAPAALAASAPSVVTVPVSVPLSGVQGAANARVPLEFARVNEDRSFLGGLLRVTLSGTVTRAGHVQVQALPDGSGLRVSVPIRAAFRAEPGGVGAFLARDFGGEATVALTVVPTVTPDWEADVTVKGDYTWTDPLSVELAQGVRVSVQSLVDAQVRAQLDALAAQVRAAVREQARLRERAGTLWARAQQPWALPTPDAAYARVTPLNLSVSPLRFTPDALKLTLGAQLRLYAGLGRAPTQAALPLPALRRSDTLTPDVNLSVPVRLPYPELSAAATREAARRTLTLPVPTSPTLRVTGVTLTPQGAQLNAAVQLQISGPLGLRLSATTDVRGTPTLDAAGQVLTLRNVTVTTRRAGLTGRVLAWLADARAQAHVTQAARFDLRPRLDAVRAQVQARLPFSPAPGVTLGGTLRALKVTDVRVTPAALVVTGEAMGTLDARVDVGRAVR